MSVSNSLTLPDSGAEPLPRVVRQKLIVSSIHVCLRAGDHVMGERTNEQSTARGCFGCVVPVHHTS